jgi:hypothetical protein
MALRGISFTATVSRHDRALRFAASLGLVLLCLSHPLSVYRSPSDMDRYFGGELESGSWRWGGSWSWDVPPFRYRILFHATVDALARALPELQDPLTTYWIAMLAGLIASFVLATSALNALLQALHFGLRDRWIGIAAWFALPPIHNAFVFPTQTKEDFLAYAIFFYGLAALLNADKWGVLLWTVLGAVTRETLMLVPGLALFVRDLPLTVRIGALAAGLGTHAVIRASLGLGEYDAFMLDANLARPALCLFSFVSILGYGWIAVAHRALDSARTLAAIVTRRSSGSTLERLWSWLPLTALAILPAHFWFGRAEEMRISALLAPWAVVGMLQILRGDPLRALCTPRVAFLIALAVLLIAAAELLGLGAALRSAMNPLVGQFSHRVWWIELYVQATLAAGVLGMLLDSATRTPRSRPGRAPAPPAACGPVTAPSKHAQPSPSRLRCAGESDHDSGL